MLIVTRYNYSTVLEDIATERFISLDTETEGLYPYHGDKFFSFSISTQKMNYYFNFNEAPDIPEEMVLDKKEVLEGLQVCIDSADFLFMMNAKFDMHFLKELDWSKANVYDIEVMAKIIYNEHTSYSLENQAKRYGMHKNDEVKAEIKERKLKEKRTREWKRRC